MGSEMCIRDRISPPLYSDNPSGLHDGETPVKWQSKASFATHPSTETEWPPKLLTRDLVAEGLNYTVICRRVCNCEPLLRFNPLNLAKVVCFAKLVKEAKCVSSDFLNEKVLMILTYIIDKGSIKITSKLEALVRTLLSGAIG